MQYTLQGLFWDYLALETTLDSIYYSGATELSGWWTHGLTWYIYIYTLAGLVTTYTLEKSSVLECQVVC